MLKSFKKRIFSFMAAAVMAVTNTLPTAPLRVFSEEITTNAETITEDSGLVMQTLEVSPDEENSDTLITLEGMMPEDAEASAVDVSEDFEGIAAYDITITSGEGEFQPDEENPIKVEIAAPVITETEGLQLWHIRDDGEREQIMDFTAEDGRIFFYAEGFSVYQIVKDTNVKPVSSTGKGWQKITKVEDLANYGEGSEGLYIAHTSGFYFKDSIDTKDSRYGIYKTKTSSDAGTDTDTAIGLGAAKYYFEQVSPTNKKQYYVYCLDGSGNKKYITNTPANSLDFVTDTNNKTKTAFTFSEGTYKNVTGIKVQSNTNTTKYWNMQGDAAGSRFCAYDFNQGGTFDFWYYVPIDNDPYKLGGKTYALMNYNGGTSGNGLMAKGDSVTAVDMLSWVIRTKNADNNVETTTLYVPDPKKNEDIDISLWTFGCISEDNYTLSTIMDGETKYLIINSDGTLSLGDETQAKANLIKVTPDTNGKILLTANGKSVTYADGTFSAGSGTYLTFVDNSSIANEDSVTYSAQKVSVSDVENKDEIIVYTRVWNNSAKSYEFYAIDHEGNLVPCYERGDNIMWVGGRINSLLWDFTEYYWEGTTDPNYYYELYNPYSRKYIAPVKTTGQVLSDNKIGINLPGRKEGEYYTDILAWDDPSYSYASLKANVDASNIENCHIVPGSRANADTFYFARVVDPEKTLTTVKTVDNNDYGITMKMIDFTTKPSGGHNEQDEILGDNTTWSNHELYPKTEILSTDLKTDGYPTTKDINGVTRSLSELFKEPDLKKVNHLFIESTLSATGYFEFDSCQNFATLKKSDGSIGTDFTVYKELGSTDGTKKNTLQHGQFFPYDTITVGDYTQLNAENLYDAEGHVLPESDPRKYEKLHKVANPDYYVGMELSANFTQTPSGKDSWGHDIIFEFTGDDDFWLYVDDELILDLGGIHSAVKGTVNFCTGDVTYTSPIDKTKPKSQVVIKKTTIRQILIDNYNARGMSQDQINTKLAEIFDNDETVYKDYSHHKMKIFYMERGAGASNLHMRFNLSYVTKGNVVLKKEVTGTEDIDYDLVDYPFQIWYEDELPYAEGDTVENHRHLLDNAGGQISVTYQNSTKKVEYKASYTPPGSSVPYQSVFFINPQKSAEIHFPAKTIKYRIIECGINNDVYDVVKVNGVTTAKESIGNTGRSQIDTGWQSVEERTNVIFENHVDPAGLRTLSFQKKLYDDEYLNTMTDQEKERHKITAEQDPTTFTFRLYLSDGVTDDLTLANMYKYYVIDPLDHYCRWDPLLQKFISTDLLKPTLDDQLSDIDNDADLTDEEKIARKAAITAQIPTFETSMNGTISKIPAWYTVKVPYIPVGTRFKIEERDSDSERPLGYDRVEYERVAGTYTTVAGEAENEGWVKKDQSPVMNVINQRGYEVEAQKIWSDKDFTSTHAPIYTALYVSDTISGGELIDPQMVPDTVRKITDDNPYVRYFMTTLPDGRSLNNYAVYEVEVSGDALFDNEGNMISGSVTRRLDNGYTTNNDLHSYSVSYEKGTISEVTINGKQYSARKDDISNDRSGGVVISLYDMKLVKTGENTYSKTPLANGVFTLYKGRSNGGTKLGIFTSNSNGKITIMYDYELDTEYELVEDTPPDHYIGLPRTVRFKLKSNTDDSNVTTYSVEFYDETADTWMDVKDKYNAQRSEYKYDEWLGWNEPATTGDQLVAYINVYNKKFTLKAEKQDFKDNSKKLEGAHFALYRGVSGVGGLVKDYDPIPGYNDLVTDEDGIIPKIDNTLEPGKYYLEEVTPPTGYKKLKEDVIFTIKKDDIVLNNQDSCFHLETTETDEHACVIRICNELDDSDLYFDIEKIIFTDKNIHNSDDEQKFVFRVDRFEETDTAMTGACDSFFVTLNCDKDMTYNSDEDIKVDGAKYNYTMFHSAADGYSFSGSGDNVTITRTYTNNGKTENYIFPTAIRTGRQTIHVKKGGIYRISEVTGWSGTDYVLWKGSNVYKGYGTPISQGGDDGCVVFSTAAVKAEKFKEASAQIDGKYRPTASFTNTETEFAYLTSQSYAENIIGRSGSQGAAP